MSLEAGQKLAHYEILEPIGKGGMGEVYRARDTKLDRDVAIKVLPEEFAGNADRLARFEREAKLLSSLNHPNIASIHGFEDEDGVKATGQHFSHYLITSRSTAARMYGRSALSCSRCWRAQGCSRERRRRKRWPR